jgi:hypothetical protein
MKQDYQGVSSVAANHDTVTVSLSIGLSVRIRSADTGHGITKTWQNGSTRDPESWPVMNGMQKNKKIQNNAVLLLAML